MPAQIKQYELKDKHTGKTFYRCELVGTNIFGAGATVEDAYADLKKNAVAVTKAFLKSKPKVGDKPLTISSPPQKHENHKVAIRKLQTPKSNRNRPPR